MGILLYFKLFFLTLTHLLVVQNKAYCWRRGGGYLLKDINLRLCPCYPLRLLEGFRPFHQPRPHLCRDHVDPGDIIQRCCVHSHCRGGIIVNNCIFSHVSLLRKRCHWIYITSCPWKFDLGHEDNCCLSFWRTCQKLVAHTRPVNSKIRASLELERGRCLAYLSFKERDANRHPLPGEET